MYLPEYCLIRDKMNKSAKVEVFLDKDVHEAAVDGEGKRTSWRNKKARDFPHFLLHKSTLLSTWLDFQLNKK